MASEGRQDLWSFPAGADLTGAQYRIAKLDENGALVLAGAGEAGWILADDPAQGHHGSVVVGGITKVVAGDEIEALEYLAADEDGKAVVATEGDVIVAQALAAGDEDELVTVVVASGIVPAAGGGD